MKKNILYTLFVLFVAEIHSQQTRLTKLKSTITTVGSASVYHISNRKINYEIQQSIGQSSIIGTKNTSKITLQQGFVTHFNEINVNNFENDIIDKSLELVISKNPFKDKITLNFSKKTKYTISVIIYDTNGKVLNRKNYAPTDCLQIPLQHYSMGTYIIHIQSGPNRFIEKLLKTE